jgi:small-conductance mechanosensitive channel
VVLPLQGLIGFLPHLLAAALVLIVGSFLAQFLGRVSQATAAGMGIEFHQSLGQLVQVLLLVVTVILAVDQLGFNLTLLTETLTNLLTVVVAGLVLTFALGARGVAGNILAGYYAREQFSLGERVVIDDQEGTLEAIGPLNVEVAVGEDRIFIPNARMIESQVRVRGKSKSAGSSEGS